MAELSASLDDLEAIKKTALDYVEGGMRAMHKGWVAACTQSCEESAETRAACRQSLGHSTPS